MTFRNESNLVFTDISSEAERTYTFPGGDVVKVQGPLQLNVSPSGGHRVFAQDGCHYIPAGWIHLHWKVRDGAPHFVK
jgi:hypothetical protein